MLTSFFAQLRGNNLPTPPFVVENGHTLYAVPYGGGFKLLLAGTESDPIFSVPGLFSSDSTPSSCIIYTNARTDDLMCAAHRSSPGNRPIDVPKPPVPSPIITLPSAYPGSQIHLGGAVGSHSSSLPIHMPSQLPQAPMSFVQSSPGYASQPTSAALPWSAVPAIGSVAAESPTAVHCTDGLVHLTKPYACGVYLGFFCSHPRGYSRDLRARSGRCSSSREVLLGVFRGVREEMRSAMGS